MNRIRMISISIVVILATIYSIANVGQVTAQGEAPPNLPGWTQGSGIHFELPDSPYLPVTLDSSFPVTLTLSSVPKVVDLTIIASPAAGSAEFTLSGFAANTLYYRYADNGLDPVTFTTDSSGSFTYTQDLSEGHHVWFQETPSTYQLYDNATGGDCETFGSWNSLTKTCTMIQNISQSIFIHADGITVDGNGRSIASDTFSAIYSYSCSNVTIKNLTVSGSPYGFYFYYGNNITVTNNTVSTSFGIETNTNSNVSVTNNTVSTDSRGISISNTSKFTVTDNTITSLGEGIRLWNADNGMIRSNTISNTSHGVFISGYAGHQDSWYNNNHDYHSFNEASTNNTVYQNNFVNNYTPIYLVNLGFTNSWDNRPSQIYYGSTTFYPNVNVSSVFNLATPDGGNYYSQFDASAEGCNNMNNDSFCDSAYIGSGGAVDNLPWTTQNGWATPPDTAAPTASPTQLPAANGADWNNSDVTVDWNWSDEADGSGIDIANCTTSSVSSGEGNPVTLNATCKDLAGNEGIASYPVMIDKTLPTVSLVGGPADGRQLLLRLRPSGSDLLGIGCTLRSEWQLHCLKL